MYEENTYTRGHVAEIDYKVVFLLKKPANVRYMKFCKKHR